MCVVCEKSAQFSREDTFTSGFLLIEFCHNDTPSAEPIAGSTATTSRHPSVAKTRRVSQCGLCVSRQGHSSETHPHRTHRDHYTVATNHGLEESNETGEEAASSLSERLGGRRSLPRHLPSTGPRAGKSAVRVVHSQRRKRSHRHSGGTGCSGLAERGVLVQLRGP